MTTLNIETPRAFLPLLSPGRYKGVYGGRGSGKSHFWAEAAIEACLLNPGYRIMCGREVQKSLAESMKRLIEDKIQRLGVGTYFECQQSITKTPGGGLISYVGLQDHTAESIKSYEGYNVALLEEAQNISDRSMTLLRPTIRAEGSEIWAGWNPRHKRDPIDKLLRGDNPPPGAIVVRANWDANPWFPKELEAERQYDLVSRPEQYEHIWEGGYAKIFEGAYFADGLGKAMREGRIGQVAADPLMALRAYWDIGGTGNKADATAIWIVQFVGTSIRVLDYYEAIGQELKDHVYWLQQNGYGRAECRLPHDGANHEKIVRMTYASALRDAGFSASVNPNKETGIAMRRVEAVRRLLPSMWFNETTTEAGRDALGAYHEKRDEDRNIGLGPDHDWASHAADAFGAMALDYEVPRAMQKITYSSRGIV